MPCASLPSSFRSSVRRFDSFGWAGLTTSPSSSTTSGRLTSRSSLTSPSSRHVGFCCLRGWHVAVRCEVGSCSNSYGFPVGTLRGGHRRPVDEAWMHLLEVPFRRLWVRLSRRHRCVCVVSQHLSSFGPGLQHDGKHRQRELGVHLQGPVL